jgi:uncharacterized protein YhbP (UPF0306 family)
MSVLPPEILAFLRSHHVLALAGADGDGMPWAASLFFAFDAPAQRLLVLSGHDTHHGAQLAIDARVAGTVAGQPHAIEEVRGLQFGGRCRELHGADAVQALSLYHAAFPQAQGMSAPVWEVELHTLKFTDNRLGFGHKVLWNRQPAESGLSPTIQSTYSETTTSLTGNAR